MRYSYTLLGRLDYTLDFNGQSNRLVYDTNGRLSMTRHG
jgi:hypothetical protein